METTKVELLDFEVPRNHEEAFRKIMEKWPDEPMKFSRTPFQELLPSDQRYLEEQYEKIFGK